MSSKKITLFMMTMMILLLGLSVVSADDINIEDTDDVVSNDISDNAAICDVQSSDKTLVTSKNIKKEAKTVIINNQTFNDYFTNGLLNDQISAGDTLDMQGGFYGSEYSMTFNTPINIMTSTHDVNISVNTTSSSFEGTDDVAAVTFKNGASGSNITGINLYNSQLYIKNGHNITINNITTLVYNQVVGRGVGQTSIRDNSTNIIVENSSFTTINNQGSSTFVLAWASNCKINNNTMTGVGNVGNLIYLTTYNVDGLEDLNLANVNNTISNNIVNGPETVQAICYGIGICGSDNYVINNTINYKGQGITTQWQQSEASQSYHNYIIGNTLNGGNLIAPKNGIVINNTVTGNLTPEEGAIVENNTAGGLKVINNYTISNNLILGNVIIDIGKSRATLENLTIKGNITTASTTSTSELPRLITINNCDIEGNLNINGLINSNITNNNISGQIILNGRARQNNNITIANNTIQTAEEYAVIINKTSYNISIEDNVLIGQNTGDESVNILATSSTVTVENNSAEVIDENKMYFTIDSSQATAGRSINLTTNLTLGNTPVNGGKVVFKINGVTIKDENGKVIYAKVVDGIATAEYNLPETWAGKTITITAVYSGYKNYSSAKSDVLSVDIVEEEENVTVFTEVDDTYEQDSNITIDVNVECGDVPVNTGKVLVKINGKTLKDENGKIIYAKVVNGTATINASLANLKAKTYTLTAIYIGSNKRVEYQTEFTIV